MDPIFGLLIEGAVKEVGKSVVSYGGSNLWKFLREGLPERALRRATANLDEFDKMFEASRQRRMARTKSSSRGLSDLETLMEDPSNGHALRTASFTASRTSSAEMHRQLADALDLRLHYGRESSKGIIADQALEVLGKLGGPHLALLGILAAIYAQREVSTAIPPLVDSTPEILAEEYVKSLFSVVPRHTDKYIINVEDARYIAALGCVDFDARVKRGLADVFARRRGSGIKLYQYDLMAFEAYKEEWSIDGTSMQDLWRYILQFCTLTPVGMLIGCLVHDAKTGTKFVEHWEWNGFDLENNGAQFTSAS